jgi:hypothetical protein
MSIENGKKFTALYVMDMQDMSEKKKECKITINSDSHAKGCTLLRYAYVF